MSRFWHPNADMSAVRDSEVVISSGQGACVTDADGNTYIDAVASLWYCNVGYGRAEISDAIKAQLDILPAYSAFGNFVTNPTLEFVERLASIAPIENPVMFLTSGGSDAVDTAAKIARRFWDVQGQPNRRTIVSRQHAFHGGNAWGTSLAGIDATLSGYGGPIIEEVVNVGHNDTESLGALFDQRGHEIAAFIGEPVIGAGGVHPPEPHYWSEVQRLCREHDILLIADEVITGFGRLGKWWGSTAYGFQPDMVTFAKGVTSGYWPLGGVLIGERVQDPFWNRSGNVLRHGYTYSGHATGSAAALANLDVLENEHLVATVWEIAPEFEKQMRRLESSSLVSEVRVAGLLAGVQLDKSTTSPAIERDIIREAALRGVITRVLVGSALQVSPPFVISAAQLEQVASVLVESIEIVASRMEGEALGA